MIIEVVQRNPSGWWIGSDSEGCLGIFPVLYTEPLREHAPKFSVPQEQKSVQLSERSQAQTASAAQRVASQQASHDERRKAKEKEVEMKRMLGLEEEPGPSARGRAKPSLSHLRDLPRPLLELIRLRHRSHLLRVETERMKEKKSALDKERKNVDKQVARLEKDEVDGKETISRLRDQVEDLEKRLNVANAALLGESIPEYCPATRPSIVISPPQQLKQPTAAVVTSSHLDTSSPKSAKAGSPLSPSEYPDKAKKAIRKFEARIQENRSTLDDYSRQLKKGSKKLSKLLTAIDETKASINENQRQHRAKASATKNKCSEALAAGKEKLADVEQLLSALQTRWTELSNKNAKNSKKFEMGNEELKKLKDETAQCERWLHDADAERQRMGSERETAQRNVLEQEAVKQRVIGTCAEARKARETQDTDLLGRLAKERQRIVEFEALYQKLLRQQEEAIAGP